MTRKPNANRTVRSYWHLSKQTSWSKKGSPAAKCNKQISLKIPLLAGFSYMLAARHSLTNKFNGHKHARKIENHRWFFNEQEISRNQIWTDKAWTSWSKGSSEAKRNKQISLKTPLLAGYSYMLAAHHRLTNKFTVINILKKIENHIRYLKEQEIF